MGLPGPKPAPLALTGGPGLDGDVIPPSQPGEPDMPVDFDPEHAEEWRKVVDDLKAMNVLGRENGAAVELYVRNLVRMRRCEAHLAQHGPIVAAPRTGVPMQNPYLAIANRAAETVAKMAAELGLTPSARGRVRPLKKPARAPAAADAYRASRS
jgi:P27 family predicted phage terminase small subunit